MWKVLIVSNTLYLGFWLAVILPIVFQTCGDIPVIDYTPKLFCCMCNI